MRLLDRRQPRIRSGAAREASGPRHSSPRATAAIGVALLLALVPAREAAATTMIALDLAELTLGADEVVVADVVEARAERAQGGMIVTRLTVRVETGLAGTRTRADELEVVTAGGELGRSGVVVHGAARLRTGQRYLLFLRRRGVGFTIVGQAQGALPVTAPARGEPIVQPAEGLPRLVRRRNGRLVDASAAITRPTPLAQVAARIAEVSHGR